MQLLTFGAVILLTYIFANQLIYLINRHIHGSINIWICTLYFEKSAFNEYHYFTTQDAAEDFKHGMSCEMRSVFKTDTKFGIPDINTIQSPSKEEQHYEDLINKLSIEDNKAYWNWVEKRFESEGFIRIRIEKRQASANY